MCPDRHRAVLSRDCTDRTGWFPMRLNVPSRFGCHRRRHRRRTHREGSHRQYRNIREDESCFCRRCLDSYRSEHEGLGRHIHHRPCRTKPRCLQAKHPRRRVNRRRPCQGRPHRQCRRRQGLGVPLRYRGKHRHPCLRSIPRQGPTTHHRRNPNIPSGPRLRSLLRTSAIHHLEQKRVRADKASTGRQGSTEQDA